MGRSRLSRQFKLFDWNQFSKKLKQEYKLNNDGKVLDTNTAVYVTFNQVTKKNVFGGTSIKEPDIDAVLVLIKLGNANCKDEDACKILEDALSEEEYSESGLTGVMLDLIIDFWTDLKLSNEHLKAAKELKELYLKKLAELTVEDKETVDEEPTD